MDVFTPLKSILAKAWVLWELVLLAEPLMICAPTPGDSSGCTTCLMSGGNRSYIVHSTGLKPACVSRTAVQVSRVGCAGEASAAVAALISMISPLPYSADFRPYFTIHDEDFGALAGGQLPDNSNALPRLLGVTNLYFLKVADLP